MSINITTGKIDIPFETYIDGTLQTTLQPNTAYSFDGSVVSFVKDFTTSDVSKFHIDSAGNAYGTIHDGHRYNCGSVIDQDGAVFIEYTDTPSTTPEPLTLNTDGISINSKSYDPGSYYVPNVLPGSIITLSQSKYEMPLWLVSNEDNVDNPDVYIGNDVQITL